MFKNCNSFAGHYMPTQINASSCDIQNSVSFRLASLKYILQCFVFFIQGRKQTQNLNGVIKTVVKRNDFTSIQNQNTSV